MNRYETYDLAACTDCLVLIANGDTPPEMGEEETAAYLAAVASFQSDRGHYVPTSWPFRDTVVGCVDDGDTVPDGPYVVDEFGDIVQTDWTEDGRARGIDREGSFSWSSCDVCRRPLGGDRYPIAELVPMNEETEMSR